jgi:hypothetical protein
LNFDLEKQTACFMDLEWNLEWIKGNEAHDHVLKKM